MSNVSKAPPGGWLLPCALLLFFAMALPAGAQTPPAAEPANAALSHSSVLDRIRAKMRESDSTSARAQRWFDSLDTDHNGEVTKQELYDSIRARFDALDENRDKVIGKAEYMKLRRDPAAGERRFGELDSNSDGRLTMPEFASPADWRFDRIDRNLDGKISRQEAERLFDRPASADNGNGDTECFYVERQIVRVTKEAAEVYRKQGYAKADCRWTPDETAQQKTRKFAE